MPLSKFMYFRQQLRGTENIGNLLVINKELLDNSSGTIYNLEQYSKVKIQGTH
jgi:hypothetical protein